MEEKLNQLAVALFILLVLIVVATVLRYRLPGIRHIFVPVSLIAGFLGLLAGPQVLGQALVSMGWDTASQGLVPETSFQIWEQLPGLLITVVFACLFLGKSIPPLKEMWRLAGPQIMLGHSMAWGQYVIGIGLTLFLLTPVWGLHPSAGALIEICFVGGHGTIAGMRGAFAELGFEEAVDIGLGLATAGVVAGALAGTVLVNWAARKDIVRLSPDDDPEAGSTQDEEPVKKKRFLPLCLSLHLSLVAIAIGVGWVLQQGLIWTEVNTWGKHILLFEYIPLFPLAMIGALMVQITLDSGLLQV